MQITFPLFTNKEKLKQGLASAKVNTGHHHSSWVSSTEVLGSIILMEVKTDCNFHFHYLLMREIFKQGFASAKVNNGHHHSSRVSSTEVLGSNILMEVKTDCKFHFHYLLTREN